MGERIGHLVRLCWKDGAGLGLFLAWVYCTLFGCGLATVDPSLAGTPATLGLERIWLFSGIAEALGGAAGLALAARNRARGRTLSSGTLALAGLAFGVLASVVVWAAWIERTVWFGRLFWIGGLLAGVTCALFTVAWGARLSAANEARIEFTVPLAFTVSFALYLLILWLKQSSVVVLALVALMCVGSTCALRSRPAPPDDQHDLAPHADAPARDQGALRSLPSFAALACASWVQIAFFRVISTPSLAGDRFTHYLYPFMLACLVSCVMLVLCIFVSRHLNVTLAFRWSMPLFVVSYVPLVADYGNDLLRMAGYALNFLGMFGVQYGCWLGASKFARRNRIDAGAVFCCLALGEGLGIAAGCAAGLYVMGMPAKMLFAVALLLLAGVQLVTMAVGFSPAWVIRRTRGRADAGVGPADGAAACGTAGTCTGAEASDATGATVCPNPAALEELFHQQARWLQATYQLTNRETEVTELLLAGRSRPFIRDELCLSLNTVGVHVRNIFAKCTVHSQQELIDLARNQG